MVDVLIILANDASTYDRNKVLCTMADKYSARFLNENNFHLIQSEEDLDVEFIIFVGNVTEENIDLFNTLVEG